MTGGKTGYKPRNCMITSWNDFDINPIINHSNFRYMIFQKEQCPTSQKIHYQIYLELKDSRDITWIKKLFNDQTIHIESRNGKQHHAIEYCSKEDTRIEGPWEYGEKAKQGERTDQCQIKQMVDKGLTLNDISDR